MEFPIIAYRLDVTRQGGYIRGRTANGSFQLGPLRFDLFGAIAAIVRGPNAAYDASTTIFSCKADSTKLRENFSAEAVDDYRV